MNRGIDEERYFHLQINLSRGENEELSKKDEKKNKLNLLINENWLLNLKIKY